MGIYVFVDGKWEDMDSTDVTGIHIEEKEGLARKTEKKQPWKGIKEKKNSSVP